MSSRTESSGIGFTRRAGLTALLAVLSFGLFASTGCRIAHLYEGEKRDREELAVVRVPYYPGGEFLTVDQIDGEDQEADGFSRIAILPGPHRLSGRARGFAQHQEGTPYSLEFLAEADTSYALVLTQKGRSEKLYISLENEDTKEKLAAIEIWP